MAATTSNTSTPANGEAPSVASHEVGMMFVHEYYTFLNKEPSRLHCFYNKQSTMSHGIQGEDTEVCHGQQSIHAKILALDFEDCKVLVSNVDSQTSLNGGIMIQVLGEMSNRGGPSQKFVQTFFLAQQPKGFYVLNDIFRYLKDDTEIEAEVVEEEQQQKQVEPEVANPTSAYEPEVAICPPAPIPEPEIAICPPAPAPVSEPEVAICPPASEPEVVICPPAPEPVVEDKKPAVEEKKAEKKHEHKKHDKKGDKKESKKDAAKKEAEVAEKPKTPEPTKKQNGSPAAAAAETAAPVAETPAPVVEAPAPAPVPAGPPKPKTWANLAANNSDQWGSQVSAAKGSSVNIPQPAAPKPQVVSQPKPQPQQQQGAPHKVSGRDEFFPIYVKNISERISEEQLREAMSKFGTVKGLDFTKQRNCAYVDFTTADAMHAALKQNKVAVGSEFVFAEERRPRPTFQNRPPPHFQTGNGGINGHQGPQGGHRGGRPARGGFQDRKPLQRPDKPAPTVAVN